MSGKELIVYGGVDSEDAEVCTPGLYVFDTGETRGVCKRWLHSGV